jgi:hypothetical protein
MPAVMLTAGEFSGAPGIKKLPLAHMDGSAGDKILEISKKKSKKSKKIKKYFKIIIVKT